MGEVEAGRIRTAVIRFHAAGERVDGHYRRTHVRYLAVEVGGHGILGSTLGLRVDRGGDLQTLRVQGVLINIEQIQKFAGDLPLDQTIGTGGQVFGLGLVRFDGQREDLLSAFLFRQRADGHHAVQNPVPASRRALEVDRRVQGRRPLDQRRKQRSLRDGQLVDGFIEVRRRRCRDAVGAATEVNNVQVCLQHLVFGPLLAHLGGDDQLLRLADQAADSGPLIADECVLDVLLGDRRPTLDVTAKYVVAHRASEAGYREARVGVEVAVLGGHYGVANVHRNLIDIDVDPVTFGRNDFRDLGTIAGEDRRHLVGADIAGLGDVDNQIRHTESEQRQRDKNSGGGRQPAAHAPA